MTAVVIVRELPGWRGEACLVRRGDEHFIVSSASDYVGPETLAFPATPEGEIVDWGEVAGGRRASREDVIAELAAVA